MSLQQSTRLPLPQRRVAGAAIGAARCTCRKMELGERHVPPCPSSQPGRPSLKSPLSREGSQNKLAPSRNQSHESLSGDDGEMPLAEFSSGEAPHERLNPRRTSWGDERGHGLKITHHGAPHRTMAPLTHHAPGPITRDHRPHTRTHTHARAHRRVRLRARAACSVRHPLQEELLPKTPTRDLLRVDGGVVGSDHRGRRA